MIKVSVVHFSQKLSKRFLAPLHNVIWHTEYMCVEPTLLFILSSTWSGLKLQKLTRMTTFVQKFPEFKTSFSNHSEKKSLPHQTFWWSPWVSLQRGWWTGLCICKQLQSSRSLWPVFDLNECLYVCTFKSSISSECLYIFNSNLVSKNIHQLLHKLCVALVLKIFRLD